MAWVRLTINFVFVTELINHTIAKNLTLMRFDKD